MIDARLTAFHGILMSRAERLQKILHEYFKPTEVAVVDESLKHSGHAGAQPQGETHYIITVASANFRGKTRIERHRMVNDAVKSEFAAGLHALQLILKTPEE
jgi:BolA protein